MNAFRKTPNTVLGWNEDHFKVRNKSLISVDEVADNALITPAKYQRRKRNV